MIIHTLPTDLIVSAEMFYALRERGLLVVTSYFDEVVGYDVRVWGEELEDGLVRCRLIGSETILFPVEC